MVDFIPPNLVEQDQRYIAVEVSNAGRKRTTITNVAVVLYKSRLRYWLKKTPDKSFIVANFFLDDPPPYELEPGSRWLVGINQDQLISEMSSYTLPFCAIYHSLSNNPVMHRIKLKRATPA